MPHIIIISLSHKHPAWLQLATQEYSKRFPKNFAVELTELTALPRTEKTLQKILTLEAEKILLQLRADDYVIVLDEHGKTFPTEIFAQRIDKLRAQFPRLIFVIGSADGLSETVKQRANLTLSLSPMTLPHGLARLLLIEQLYRTYSILHHHPYHRP